MKWCKLLDVLEPPQLCHGSMNAIRSWLCLTSVSLHQCPFQAHLPRVVTFSIFLWASRKRSFHTPVLLGKPLGLVWSRTHIPKLVRSFQSPEYFSCPSLDPGPNPRARVMRVHLTVSSTERRRSAEVLERRIVVQFPNTGTQRKKHLANVTWSTNLAPYWAVS